MKELVFNLRAGALLVWMPSRPFLNPPAEVGGAV